jgi:phosphoglycolate phosphatase-like HAD superfamily hydrolase
MIGVAASDLQAPHCYQPQNTAPSSEQLTVFCDFDGPIVDVSKRYYTTYKLALADTQATYQAKGITLPIQMLEKQQFWQMKQNRVPDVEIAMRSGLQGEQIDFFLEDVLEIVNQPVLLREDKIQPGVGWALALLHSQGVRLVLVTLRCRTQATQILRNYGLSRLFSGIYGTCDAVSEVESRLAAPLQKDALTISGTATGSISTGVSSPGAVLQRQSDYRNAAYHNPTELKTQLLEKAIAEQSLLVGRPFSAWMVGDTEADLLAGQALSISTIALTCGIRSHFYLQQFQPTLILSNLLAVAHHLTQRIKVEA